MDIYRYFHHHHRGISNYCNCEGISIFRQYSAMSMGTVIVTNYAKSYIHAMPCDRRDTKIEK